MIKPILLSEDTISREEIDGLRDWLGTYPRLTKGPVTAELEERFAGWLGVRHATFVNSGSSAILLAIAALMADGRLKRGDKVVVPAVSWLTDASSPMLLGLNVVLCDCNLTDLSLDLGHLSKIMAEHSIKLVILVSVLGLSPAMPEVCAMCTAHGALLMEDVCESLGTDYAGSKLGTFGDVSVFSTYYGHHISTVEGGMVCTQDTRLHLTVNAMRSHGWTRDWPAADRRAMSARNDTNPFNEAYTFYYPGMNLRNTDLQAFLGLTQVQKIDEVARARHELLLVYHRLLGGRNRIAVGRAVGGSERVSCFAYPYLFPAETARESAMRGLSSVGIECRPLIAGSMAEQPFFRTAVAKREAVQPSGLPNAGAVHDCGIYLPLHPGMSVDDVERVCRELCTHI